MEQTASTRTNLRATLGRLSTTYGAQYRDYFEDARFQTADFADYDHLNRGGAQKLSELLRDEVVVPAVQQGH